jgi:hypothetical protein
MKFILFIITIIITLFSCKKKTNPDPSASNSNFNNIPNNYTYGSMATVYYQNYSGNTITNPDSAISAIFYSDPLNPSGSAADAGIISFNGNTLIGNANFYTAYDLNIHQPNSVWAVSGNSVVPTINYTLTPNYPIFTGNAQLPDSFSVSSSLTFTLTGINNNPNSSVFVQLSDYTKAVNKTLNVNQNVCSFSTTDLATFQPNTYVYISVNLSNSLIFAVNGKKYAFTSSLNHTKSGILAKP